MLKFLTYPGRRYIWYIILEYWNSSLINCKNVGEWMENISHGAINFWVCWYFPSPNEKKDTIVGCFKRKKNISFEFQPIRKFGGKNSLLLGGKLRSFITSFLKVSQLQHHFPAMWSLSPSMQKVGVLVDKICICIFIKKYKKNCCTPKTWVHKFNNGKVES